MSDVLDRDDISESTNQLYLGVNIMGSCKNFVVNRSTHSNCVLGRNNSKAQKKRHIHLHTTAVGITIPLYHIIHPLYLYHQMAESHCVVFFGSSYTSRTSRDKSSRCRQLQVKPTVPIVKFHRETHGPTGHRKLWVNSSLLGDAIPVPYRCHTGAIPVPLVEDKPWF